MSEKETRKAARLVDNSPDGWVLVQENLAYDAFKWQQIIAQVDMGYMAHALEGGRYLTPLWKQPLQASTASDDGKSAQMFRKPAQQLSRMWF